MTGFRIFAAGISLAVATGCGGSAGGVAPDGSFGAVPRAVRRDRGASWMDRDAVSRARLLYVTDGNDGDVYVLSVPTGKLVGRLSGFDQPLGDCVDRQGDVFIVNSQDGNIREFHHGAKEPFNVLNDGGYYPLGCSVDPTSGNLAVTNIIGNGNGSPPGNVAIYRRAKGRPKYYSDKKIFQYGYCSYDALGNLYIDGITRPTFETQVAELPRAAKEFVDIALDQSLGGNNVSALEWDGDYLAIASQDSGVIYQFAITGHSGKKTGTTRLRGATGVGAFTIVGRTLYAPIYQNIMGSVGVYRYPAGGKAKQKYYAVINPWSATLSIKQETRRSGVHL